MCARERHATLRNAFLATTHGGMAERSNAAVLKTVVSLAGPGVRIPLPPP
jgi:hypothetical protein